ncbi:dihydroorotase [Porphyromonas sp.]|uniref:dihydroorotase n=1 Tax=Porphyromonas sp. TaxID=1924944 RepID=UPI0026DA8518|nr:dihydroorotase [Porphyromonas sp.]MDO4695780.1 dihydroorotase [Porphyromonas sp.]MDO4771541.1 dihydroorotase [Porphyromonas sp.]
MHKIWIKDALIVNEGTEYIGSIEISGKRISRVIEGEGVDMPSDISEVIEAKGMMCIPGVIDDQVHFRDPGLTHKGSLETESKAALMGGVTSFMDMPNTNPQTTSIEAWRDKMVLAAKTSYANYSFYMGATNDNADVLGQLDLVHTPGVKVFMGASTGNMLVDRQETLRRIFAESPVLIAIHSESEDVIRRNKETYIEKYGDDIPVRFHPSIRSEEACYESTRRAVALAKETGARLHVLHLSTAKELEFFSADRPLSEKHITAEVCVHHLWFDDSQYETLGTRIKWNPAVKTVHDRDALRQAAKVRQVDVIATDHAPHLMSEKEGGALKAASGGPLVEHSLALSLELVDQGVFTVSDVVDLMCHRPAQLFGIKERGFLREGYFADIVLVSRGEEWNITDDKVHYKCGWTPLNGTTLHNRVRTTILNGQIVVRDHQWQGVHAAEALEFEHRKR